MDSGHEGSPSTSVHPLETSISEKADVLGRVAAASDSRGLEAGRAELVAGYQLTPVEKSPSRYSKRQMLAVYYRDGFLDS